MTKGFKDRFIAERARALAIMYLTWRDDLAVEDADMDSGLDYLVDIVQRDDPSQRSFGVVVRAAMAPVTAEQADAEIGPWLKVFQRPRAFAYPVCLFFFTMREDRAYHTWLLEPVITPQGKPKLAARSAPDCRQLDNEVLDDIVSRFARGTMPSTPTFPRCCEVDGSNVPERKPQTGPMSPTRPRLAGTVTTRQGRQGPRIAIPQAVSSQVHTPDWPLYDTT